MDSPKPVIAAVEGFVSGIAGAFVLAADLVVMSEEAFLHLPFQTIALIPDGGLCWFVARALGHQRAFEMAIESQRWSAARCLELGLINRTVPAGTALAAAREWAARLAAGPVMATAALKRTLRAAATGTLDESLELEVRLQRECIHHPDFAEGVRAFLEKRPPTLRRLERRAAAFPPGLAPASMRGAADGPFTPNAEEVQLATNNRITLYDLQLASGCTISPFVWATKYALAHKGFDIDIVPGGFTGIMERTGGRLRTPAGRSSTTANGCSTAG